MDHERRNNRWVPEVCLRLDSELIDSEVQRIHEMEEKRQAEQKKSDNMVRLFQNNEHGEWDESMIQKFLETTRIKTVEFICLGD